MIITILRKPLDGSVAENTLKHGCGAINIDDTRVGDIVQDTSKNGRSPNSHKATVFQSGLKDNFEGKITTGRWPANFILIHKDSCELKGTKKVKSDGHWTQKANIGKFYEGGWSHQEIDEGNKMSDEDGKETVANWDCEQDCPVKELDRQSGVSKSPNSYVRKSGNVGKGSYGGNIGQESGSFSKNFGDEGGSSRFFKQFKKDDDQ